MLQGVSGLNCSSATLLDLLPDQLGVADLNVTRLLFSAAATSYPGPLLPSPEAGYVLFATYDKGFAKPTTGKYTACCTLPH